MDSDPRPQLVVGDDGSPPCDVVWLWVNNHRWPGWRISVVCAHPVTSGPPPGERGRLRPAPPVPGRQLFTPGPGTTVEHLEADGDPRVVLDSCTGAALMAVGPRGRHFLKRMHLGSTVDWLLSAHRPLVPLVIVRSARPVRQVVLCVDGSGHAQAAAEALARLPWLGDVRVTVLAVCERGVDPEAAVDAAAAVVAPAGDVVRRVTQPGADVRTSLLRALDEERPDLVAIGSAGRAGPLRRRTLGATADAITASAACSVLVARRPDPADLAAG
ncbi:MULTISPECIES: universal stress protein [unclassified Blastococcus]